MSPAHIYALTDPATHSVRYVGRTIQPLDVRLGQHWALALRHDHSALLAWLAGLRHARTKPAITLLETVPRAEMNAAERRWIAHFRAAGAALVNTAPGGGGSTWAYVVTWTPERDARLGQEADAIIAADLGVTRKAVSYRRRLLGIAPSYDRQRMKPPPNNAGHNALSPTPEIVAELGTMPDSTLAARCGVSKKVIGRWRRQRGIASYAQQSGNNGHYRTGNFPARWLKDHGSQHQPAAPGAGPPA